jgi:hypothetical protein
MAIADRVFVGVPIDDLFEVAGGVAGRGSRDSKAYCIEVIKNGAPKRLFADDTSSMACIRDDRIECMERDR